jgi:tetratricopeptide (TPR) repeat protein
MRELEALSQHPACDSRRAAVERERSEIHDAMREASFEDVIKRTSEADLNVHEQAGTLWDLLVPRYGVVTGTCGDPNSTLAALDRGIEIAARVESGGASDQGCRIMHSIFLLKRGATLFELRRNDDAARALTTDIPNFKIPAASTGHQEKAQAYDSIARWLLNLPSPRLVEDAALALYNAAAALAEMKQHDWAIRAYSAIVGHTPKTAGAELRRFVANSMSNKGAILVLQHEFREAIKTCDELIRQFRDPTDRSFSAPVAPAYVNKGISLYNQNLLPQAIADFDEVIQRSGEAPGLDQQRIVAHTLLHKGLALTALDRPGDAIAAYDDLIKRTKHASDPALQSLASEATAERQKLAENVSPKNFPPESPL